MIKLIITIINSGSLNKKQQMLLFTVIYPSLCLVPNALNTRPGSKALKWVLIRGWALIRRGRLFHYFDFASNSQV